MIIPPPVPFSMLAQRTLDSIVFLQKPTKTLCFSGFPGFPGFFTTMNFTGQRFVVLKKPGKSGKPGKPEKHSVFNDFGQIHVFFWFSQLYCKYTTRQGTWPRVL